MVSNQNKDLLNLKLFLLNSAILHCFVPLKDICSSTDTHLYPKGHENTSTPIHSLPFTVEKEKAKLADLPFIHKGPSDAGVLIFYQNSSSKIDTHSFCLSSVAQWLHSSPAELFSYAVHYLINSLLILSSLATPSRKLLPPDLLCVFLAKAIISTSYIIAGLSTILYTFPFTLGAILPS